MTRAIPQRPHLLKIIPPLENSIVIKGDGIAWNNPWHFHPEIELIYCIKGKGVNFIGNSIENIEEGEIILLGENLPHTRQRDRAYYTAHPDETPESVVFQFRKDFAGEQFFHIKEFAHINELLARASRGLKFSGAGQDEVRRRLLTLHTLSPAAAVLEVVAILEMLARCETFTFFNAPTYVADAHEKVSQKINKVYHYTIDHFREPIALEQVAALTNHSPAAFCRYFKTRTRKSYFQYLTEVRIEFACGLLKEGNLDVSEVCFASGFNNLSNFHKQFKKVKDLTPNQYKQRSLQKVPTDVQQK